LRVAQPDHRVVDARFQARQTVRRRVFSLRHMPTLVRFSMAHDPNFVALQAKWQLKKWITILGYVPQLWLKR
jgi:hypothetical protein